MINSQIYLLNRLINNPYIVRYYQSIYSVEKQRIFIVLEYCSKGSILKLIQDQSYRSRKKQYSNHNWIKTVQKYFKQTVNALLYMHSLNIIHRDIKSDNILITNDDTIRIIDFNISEQINPNGLIKIQAGRFLGTKGYAAPQLFFKSGQKQATILGKALDIWSLGITLLEMLQKKHPFQSRNLTDLQQCVHKEIPIRKDYQDSLILLLKGMLQKNNSKRWKIQQVAANQWVTNK